MRLLIFSFAIFLFCSCKKDKTVCYECKDANGTTLQTYCAEDEDAAFNQAKGGTFGGIVINTKAQFLQACPKK